MKSAWTNDKRLHFSLIIFLVCLLFTVLMWDHYFNSAIPLDRTLISNIVLAMGTLFSVAAGLFTWSLETGYKIMEVSAIEAKQRQKELEEAYRKLQLSEAKLRQAHKMEAVGRLAGGVAHDFNNMLTIILGCCDLLLKHLPQNDSRYQEVEEMKKAGEQAALITRQLLAFSRRQRLKPTLLNFNGVVEEMKAILRRLLGDEIEISCRLDPDLGAIRADPGQLQQVILNLAVNARDAMPKGGNFIIETFNATVDETEAQRYSEFQPGSYIALRVTDTGIGMDESLQAHLFEPFFTTKEKGTGLGLATVYGIVKQSGGHILIFSEVGKGSAFSIYLPRAEEAIAHQLKPAAPPPSILPRGTETVLLVEDEPGVRRMARQLLAENGYRVLEAGGSAEALEISRRHTGPIQLLLTDVAMPKMNGKELADRFTVLRPGMKVLYMSGYAEIAGGQADLFTDERSLLIEKPFTAEMLAFKVREVLDQPQKAA